MGLGLITAIQATINFYLALPQVDYCDNCSGSMSVSERRILSHKAVEKWRSKSA